MRLTALEPRWAGEEGYPKQAVSFRCPHCQERIVVPFENPVGGVPKMREKVNFWKRDGETFETLTLEPSVHQIGHWHGWIKNGEASNA
jgi:hypothetical protein